MAAPILFLESMSAHRDKVHSTVVMATAKQFIQTLVRARRVNAKISLNSNTNLGDCELAPGETLRKIFAGQEFREEWTFLKVLATQSPLSHGFEESLKDLELTEVTTSANGAIGDCATAALIWANLLETGTISFHVEPEWLSPWVAANFLTLDQDGKLSSYTKNIPNASAPEHVDQHQQWLKKLGNEQHPSADQFWAEKESRYPGLRFLARVRNQINDLATSGAPYRQALGCLALLSDDAVSWAGAGLPVFSTKIADGEHDGRRALSAFDDELTNTNHIFDRHAYFTGGTAGRIHFRLASEEQKFVIAHVGLKL